MHFNLEITKNCNQKCFYCFNDSGHADQKNELSLVEWKKVISEIHTLGHKSVHITGGEPFLHPNIIEILTHAIGLGLETTILSNGYKIAMLAEKHQTLFSKLKLAQISLDAMDPNVHNARRGFSGAFKDAIDAINSLQKVNVPIEISTTVSDQSLSQLIDIGRYCESIHASLIIRELIQEGRCQAFDANIDLNISLRKIKEILQLHCKANIVDDQFNYVVQSSERDKYVKNYGTVTVEASGKISGQYIKYYTINSLLNQLKVA